MSRQPWWEVRTSPPPALWAALFAVVLSGCSRDAPAPPAKARKPHFAAPVVQGAPPKPKPTPDEAWMLRTGEAPRALRQPTADGEARALVVSGEGVAPRLLMRGGSIEASGLRPRASLALVATGPLVLGWLRAGADGCASLDLGHPAPPGEYALEGDAGRFSVVVEGDRAGWRRSAEAELRKWQLALMASRAELQRMAGSALDGAKYRVGKARDFDERRWRSDLTRWAAGLAEVREALRAIRRRHVDLVRPERYRGLVEASRLMLALGRMRSRQLYQLCRRKAHPDDVEDLAAPGRTLQIIRRRISLLLR